MNTLKDFKVKVWKETTVGVVALLLLLLLLLLSSFIVAYVYSSLSSNHSISSIGWNEGYGFYVDDPDPICEPLGKIGEGPPQDAPFCAALGCPYNPPELRHEDPSGNSSSNSSNTG
jgi:hypothetical protein